MAPSLYDEATAANYDEGFRRGYGHLYPNENIVRLEKWYFKEGRGRLLDYGYGFGANLLHFAQCGYSVEGIDVAESARELVLSKLQANQNNFNISLRTLSAQNGPLLPYPDCYFNYIVANQVVYHLGSKDSIALLLAEFFRVLKPDGKMIVTLLGPTNIFCLDGKKVNEHIYKYVDTTGTLGNRPMRVYVFENEKHIREIFNQFQIDEVGWFDNNYCGINGYHFVVLCRKPLGKIRG